MVSKYKKIVVAIDGSEQSEEAVKEAVAIAKRNETSLEILTVSDVTIFDTEAHNISYLLEQADITAKHILNKAEEIISNEVLYNTHMVTGKPKSAIVNFVEEEKPDLLIMGATGKGAFSRLLLGSTTAYVVNNAPCNVLVVR